MFAVGELKPKEKVITLTKENTNIVREIESRRIVWLRYLERVEEHRLGRRIIEWKTIASVPRGKGKAFPLQAWTGPWRSRRLRLQNF
jgi:hypothetical protein